MHSLPIRALTNFGDKGKAHIRGKAGLWMFNTRRSSVKLQLMSFISEYNSKLIALDCHISETSRNSPISAFTIIGTNDRPMLRKEEDYPDLK